MSAIPASMASRGEVMVTGLPATLISPSTTGSMPQITRASDERPEPSRPASPTTSLRCTTRLTFLGLAAPETFISSSSGSPIAVSPRTTSERPRERLPTMWPIIVSIGSSDSGAVTTWRPSRRIVARSAIRMISSMRCDT